MSIETWILNQKIDNKFIWKENEMFDQTTMTCGSLTTVTLFYNFIRVYSKFRGRGYKTDLTLHEKEKFHTQESYICW